jgi:hypothetical protein
MNMTPFQVPVTKLDFDLQNPRFPVQTSQREALDKILLDSTAKTIKLAEHIIANGQNPIDLLAVYETEGRRYVVLEGNRRTAVLKALSKPVLLDSLPPGAGVPAFIKKMKQLAAQVSHDAVSKINVVSFPTREEADVWILLKHTGENDGAGTVGWDGTQRARFRKGDVGMNLIDFGKANGWFTDDQLTARGPFPITTFNRLLGDPGVRAIMGVEKTGGKLQSLVPVAELEKVVTRVVQDLAKGEWNVTKLKSKAQRQGYMEQLPKSVIPKTQAPEGAWAVDPDVALEVVSPPPKTRVREKPLTRTTLIPKNFTISASDSSPRLGTIYRELKALQVEKQKNAVAVLLRVFIELSLDDYIPREKVTIIRKDAGRTTLADKAISAAAHLKKSDKLNKNQEDIVSRLVGNGQDPKTEVTSITTLHAFVHSRHSSPLPSELLTIWDNISDFMRLITHVQS